MNPVDNYIASIRNLVKKKYNNTSADKIVLVHIYSIIGLAVSIVYLGINIMAGKFLISGALFGVMIFFLTNFLFLIKKQNYEYAGILFNIILTITFLTLIFINGENFSFYLLITYPPVSIFLLNNKRSALFVATLLLIILTLGILPSYPYLDIQNYTFYNLVISYIASYLMAFSIEYIKNSSYKNLEKTAFDTQKSIKEKDEFISKMSHQIRTPLNSILATSSLMNGTRLTKRQKDMIDTIEASANNLLSVAKNIKEVKTQRPDKEEDIELEFYLSSIVKNTIDLFSSTFQENIHLNIHTTTQQSDKVRGNPIKIKQIFLNLMENLVNYSHYKEEQTIEIDITPQKENNTVIEYEFNINSNTPINFPVKSGLNKKYSFIDTREHPDFFNDLQNSNILDLKITKDLIDSLKGTFNIKADDQKTHYIFQLPFKKIQSKNSATQTDDKKTDVQGLNIDNISSGNKASKLEEAHILLVEDNAINQKIMRLSLEKYIKEMDMAEDGKEALNMFGKKRYDLILMDIRLPGMDGIKTTEKLRETEIGSGVRTPIIAITANALEGDREKCISAGMDDYISKPFQIEELIKLLKKHLSLQT